MTISQFFGDSLTNIIWFLLFIILAFLYPRIMIAQMLFKLEQTAQMLEDFTLKAKNIVIKKISKKPKKDLKDAISNFLEFFMIEPVSLDPFGIVKKIEHIVNLSEKRFNYFVSRVAPRLNPEEKANLVMGLSGAISLNQIAKIVRHYVELIRKTKNLQLALILQMQLPLVEKISKALLKGTEALTNGWPVGDSVGAFVAAHLIGKEKVKEIEEDTIMAKKRIKRKEVYIIKAKGPGGRLGKLGRAVEKIVKREKVAKIITIDAALKLEGEKTGSMAEGIGVAIGGVGVDRAYIEEIASKKNIPLDSIIIKMSQEEAIQPIRKEILISVPKVLEAIERNVEETKGKGKILIVGVGNTAGVGNSKKEAEEAEKLAKKVLVKEKLEE
ncbi:MAG: DUF1512 family protein, partial [Candidatus Aenigmatarchaeota archaeon]